MSMAAAQSELSTITETVFLEKAKTWTPPTDPESAALKPPFLKRDATEEEKAAFVEARKKYIERLSQEIGKLSDGDDSSLCYLALQPT